MRIDFYHLAVAPLEKVLPAICERVLAGGGRLLIVTGADQVEALDRLLWTYAPESFLPHSSSAAARAADQPILIGAEQAAANGARNIALADGVWRDAALNFDRAFYFFDAAAIDVARTSWRTLKAAAAAELHFWKQDEAGRWTEGP